MVADDGKAAHIDDDHLEDFSRSGASAAGNHEIDMGTLAPGPAPYTVTAANAYLREDADPTQIQLDVGKKVSLAAGTSPHRRCARSPRSIGSPSRGCGVLVPVAP